MHDLYSPFLTAPLSTSEQMALHEWLKEVRSMTLFEAHGFISAIISSPEPIAPATWFPVMFGPDLPNRVSVQEMNMHLNRTVRMYHQITQTLAKERALIPLIDFNQTTPSGYFSQEQQAHLRQWCQGYLNGTDITFEAWQALKGFNHLFLILTTLMNSNPTPESMGLGANTLTPGQMNKVLNDFVNILPALLIMLYQQAHGIQPSPLKRI